MFYDQVVLRVPGLGLCKKNVFARLGESSLAAGVLVLGTLQSNACMILDQGFVKFWYLLLILNNVHVLNDTLIHTFLKHLEPVFPCAERKST